MHNWQDIVLATGSIIFSVALIPSILSKHKPALLTSCLTFSVLVAYIVTYASLTFWYATFGVALNALCWGILAVQKLQQLR
jgi:hypothetical protein